MNDTSKLPKPSRQANNNRSNAQRRGSASHKPVTPVTYDDIEAETIRRAITTVTDNGCAIIFGKTSDGGAYSVTMLDGDERVRDWPHDAEGLARTLAWLESMFDTD